MPSVNIYQTCLLLYAHANSQFLSLHSNHYGTLFLHFADPVGVCSELLVCKGYLVIKGLILLCVHCSESKLEMYYSACQKIGSFVYVAVYLFINSVAVLQLQRMMSP